MYEYFVIPKLACHLAEARTGEYFECCAYYDDMERDGAVNGYIYMGSDALAGRLPCKYTLARSGRKVRGRKGEWNQCRVKFPGYVMLCVWSEQRDG